VFWRRLKPEPREKGEDHQRSRKFEPVRPGGGPGSAVAANRAYEAKRLSHGLGKSARDTLWQERKRGHIAQAFRFGGGEYDLTSRKKVDIKRRKVEGARRRVKLQRGQHRNSMSGEKRRGCSGSHRMGGAVRNRSPLSLKGKQGEAGQWEREISSGDSSYHIDGRI